MTEYSVGVALRNAGLRLAEVAESGQGEARLLLGKTLARSREWLHAHPESVIPPERYTEFEELVARRAQGYPLPYLLGEWEFYGRMFAVSETVLIPRPETELLVDTALDWSRLRNLSKPLRILDVGTGTGCIAITLAAELPGSLVLAVDVSRSVLEVTRANIDRHRIRNVEVVRSDLLDSVRAPEGGFDLVCANLPYIPSGKLDGLAVSEFEPRLALDGGPDGLTLVRRLLAALPPVVAPGGLVLLEIEADQGFSATSLARAQFPGARVELARDYADQERMVAIYT